MVNFYDLEKRCKKLQRKRVQKVIFYLLLLTIVIGGIALFLFQKSGNKQIIKNTQKVHIKSEKKIEKQQTKAVKQVTQLKKPKSVEKKDKVVTVVKTKKIEKKETTEKQNSPKIKMINYIIEMENIGEINFSTPQVAKNETKNREQNETKNRKKVNHYIQTKNLTFEKALNSAELYYNNGNYKQTIKWCKIASSIDNENEEIWKLYALSLERMGDRKKAIKVLKTYLKYRKSTELKLILERLEK
jgi:tetratricopeptide (TPR) repeat protein